MQQKNIKRIVALFLIVLVPVLLVVGAYGFVWWKISEFADNFAHGIAPYAEMTYQDIHIDLLQSEVGLRGMSFTPVGMKGKIGIESAVLKAPTWGFILNLDEQLSKGELPESLYIDTKNIELDLQSGYMQDWGRIAADVQRQAGASYETLACGDLDFFSIADVRKMGYSRILTNLSLQYEFDKLDRQINIDIQSSTANMADTSLSMNVGVASDVLTMQTLVFAQPQLKRVKARFNDKGYNARKNTYCANLNEEPVSAYRQRYAEMLNSRLDYEGWTIPTPLFTAFDGLNNPGGAFYLRVDIPQGFGVQSIAVMRHPVDLLDTLTPYLELNGKAVMLDGLDWNEPDPEGDLLLHELRVDEEKSAQDVLSETDEKDQAAQLDEMAIAAPVYERRSPYAKRRTKNKEDKKSFKPVELSVLASHLGEPVILYTYFGRKVEGRLVSVGDRVITIEHRLIGGRGTATYPIAKDKVQSARLYY